MCENIHINSFHFCFLTCDVDAFHANARSPRVVLELAKLASDVTQVTEGAA